MPRQGDFLIDALLNLEGLTEAQKQTVEAAIPALKDMVAIVAANPDVINLAVALYGKAQPMIAPLAKDWTTGGVSAGLKAVMEAIAARQQQQ
jgi:hypothetical protein